MKLVAMLETLLNQNRCQCGHPGIRNPTVPNTKNGRSVAESAPTHIKPSNNFNANGNAQDVMNLFHNHFANPASNPVVQNIFLSVHKNPAANFALLPKEGVMPKQGLILTLFNRLTQQTRDCNKNNFKVEGILTGLGKSLASQSMPYEKEGVAENRRSWNTKYTFAFY